MLEEVLARIEMRLESIGLSATAASRLATGHPDAIRDLRRGLTGKGAKRIGVSSQMLIKLAPVLQTNVEWLATGKGDPTLSDSQLGKKIPTMPNAQSLPKDVPVMGTAAGSLGEGAFQMTPGPIDYVRRPPALENAVGIYALFVENDSMAPEHRPGDLRFAHPHRTPLIGDSVIIQIRLHPGSEIRSYIKHLVRRTPKHVVCAQLNPVATIHFAAETVVAVHKILSMNDLFGV